MKQPSRSLHKIVHRLSYEEQRLVVEFIKLNKHRGENNILIDLFTAVLRQKTYDEELLKKQLKYPLNNNSFKTYKSELKELILDILRALRNYETQSMKYRRISDHAELLIAKELYPEALSCIKHLQKTITPDFQERNRLIFIEALELEYKVLQHISNGNMVRKEKISKNVFHHSFHLASTYQARSGTHQLARMASCNLLLNEAGATEEFEQLKNTATSFAAFQNNPDQYYVVQQGFYTSLLEGDFIKHFDYTMRKWMTFQKPDTEEQLRKEHPFDYGDSFISFVRAAQLTRNSEMMSFAFSTATSGYYNLFFNSAYYASFVQFSLQLFLYLIDDTYSVQNNIDWFEKNCCPAEPENDMLRYRWFNTTLAIMYHSIKDNKSALRCVHKVMNTNPNDLTEIHYRCFCVLFRFVIEYEMLQNKTSTDRAGFERVLLGTINILNKQHNSKEGNKNRSYELAFLKFMKALAVKDKEGCTKHLAELKSFSHLPAAKHYNALFPLTEWAEKRTA